MHAQIKLRRRCLVGVALAAIATGAFAGEITLYRSSDFQGDTLTLQRAAPDLERTGFNDTASSVIVRNGVWEVCTEPYYHGNCTQLRAGEYNRMAGTLDDPIASAREIATVAVAPPPAPAAVVTAPANPPIVAASGPRIALYAQPGFAGSGVEITETHGALDRIPAYVPASAVIVYGGTWRLCTREYYRGQCADFAPGRYDSLGGLNGRIYSAELVSPSPAPVGVVTPVYPGQGRVVLYERPDFAGQSLVIDSSQMPNLDRMNFGDRAASMRIDSGYWQFCTDLQYRGSCTTYGPGEYPRLAPDIDHKIASVRRVNDVYGAISVR